MLKIKWRQPTARRPDLDVSMCDDDDDDDEWHNDIRGRRCSWNEQRERERERTEEERTQSTSGV